MPGRLIVRQSRACVVIEAACIRLWITVSGLERKRESSCDTGQIASSPRKGSRIMLLTNEEAARFGLPGRTHIVGNLSTTPSTNRSEERRVGKECRAKRAQRQ